MNKVGLFVSIGAALIAAPALAQDGGPDRRAEAAQIGGAEPERAAQLPQETAEGRATQARQLDVGGGGTELPAQLSNVRQSSEALPQLSRDGDRRTTPQLSRGGRTAQAAEPLSQPAEGRTGDVARVEGNDRCDPADRASRTRAACRRVIETRSAEFQQAEPNPLSPEQRLLIDQRSRSNVGNQGAARRLATNNGNPDEFQDQAIASVALANSAPDRPRQEEEPSQLSSETQAVVQAIVNQLTNPR